MPTTGTALLPDIGTLSYNGVTFSCLYHSSISGKAAKDNAGRTIKAMEYTLTVEGVVTLNNLVATSVDNQWIALRRQLDQQAGQLQYSGKGFGNLTVNPPGGGGTRDIAWGPRPETLYFQPLGGSNSALIAWTVTFTIAEVVPGLRTSASRYPFAGRVVQFNNEVTVGYDDECYSVISMKGTLEIPLTRATVSDRTVPTTIDSFRQDLLNYFISAASLDRFRVTSRHFVISRDRRSCEWDFQATEIPYMGLPPNATNARGTYSVKPLSSLGGMCRWGCTLKATYTISRHQPRRWAWYAFICLCLARMSASSMSNLVIPIGNNVGNAPPRGNVLATLISQNLVQNATAGLFGAAANLLSLDKKVKPLPDQRAILKSFSIDEGLYLDSRTITFEAMWWLFTSLSHVLLASGVWRKSGIEGLGANGVNNWASSVRQISGWRSWLANRLDPANNDVIVDLGGP
jgi:hypothetical protein